MSDQQSRAGVRIRSAPDPDAVSGAEWILQSGEVTRQVVQLLAHLRRWETGSEVARRLPECSQQDVMQSLSRLKNRGLVVSETPEAGGQPTWIVSRLGERSVRRFWRTRSGAGDR